MDKKVLKATANTEVRSWYHEAYPNDSMWTDILPRYTFEGLFKALDRRMYSYTMFANDSVIRERILSQLAAVMEVPTSEVLAQFDICSNIDSPIWGDTEGMEKAIGKIYEVMS